MDTPIANPINPARCQEHDGTCLPLPEFRRLRYLYGQLLGAADLQAEQSYHREKLRLNNRCLHGYGVICGLLVHPAKDPAACEPDGAAEARVVQEEIVQLEEQRPKAEGEARTRIDGQIETLRQRLKMLPDPACNPAPPTRITIDCGVALDCEGNELVLRRPLTLDPWTALSAEERKRAGDGPATLYITLCYCEQGIDPIRPVLSDSCGTTAACSYGKLREAVRVGVSLAKPHEDTRCETCCTTCEECCLLLARIEGFKPSEE